MLGMLPDILRPDLRLVICGTAAGTRSAARAHYYSGPGNAFWHLLHESGLVPVRLSPERDADLVDYGIGLTDLAKGVAQSHDRGLRRHYDTVSFLAKIDALRPLWVAFHGKESARVVARALGHPAPRLGLQEWQISTTRTFVLPSGSGANRGGPYDGRPTRLAWWHELAVTLTAPQ